MIGFNGVFNMVNNKYNTDSFLNICSSLLEFGGCDQFWLVDLDRLRSLFN